MFCGSEGLHFLLPRDVRLSCVTGVGSGDRGGTTHTGTLRGRGRVIFVSGVLLALLGTQTTLDSLKQHRIKIPILPRRHLND